MEQLTLKQKKLAEDNHNLIYLFAKNNHLSIDDYYGILAIGLCNASKIYDESKGRFSTIAYRCMLNEYLRHNRDMNRKHIIPKELIVSYNASSNCQGENDKDDKCFIRYLESSSYSFDNDVINKVTLESLWDSLTKKERAIIKYFNKGLNQPEIAKEMNCTRQNISKSMSSIRFKLQDLLDN